MKWAWPIEQSMQHLSDIIFVQMVNMTLLHHDSYHSSFEIRLKLDTIAALRNAYLQIGALFPDDVLRRTQDEIGKHEALCTLQPGWDTGRFGGKCNNRYQPY